MPILKYQKFISEGMNTPTRPKKPIEIRLSDDMAMLLQDFYDEFNLPRYEGSDSVDVITDTGIFYHQSTSIYTGANIAKYVMKEVRIPRVTILVMQKSRYASSDIMSYLNNTLIPTAKSMSHDVTLSSRNNWPYEGCLCIWIDFPNG